MAWRRSLAGWLRARDSAFADEPWCPSPSVLPRDEFSMPCTCCDFLRASVTTSSPAQGGQRVLSLVHRLSMMESKLRVRPRLGDSRRSDGFVHELLPMTKTHVFLGVFDFGDDLDAVTAILGVDPTESWLRGDAVPPHPTARRTHRRWSLHSGLPTTASFEDQLAALLVRLEALGDRVREVASRFTAVIWAAIYTPETNPALAISAATARRLGALELGIDFDIYVVPEEDRPVEQDQSS